MSMTRKQLILIKIAEECTELAKDALKAAQFGMDDCKPGEPITNRERMIGESHDLFGVLTMLEDEDGYSYTTPSEADIEAKMAKVERFICYSQDRGMVEKVSAI